MATILLYRWGGWKLRHRVRHLDNYRVRTGNRTFDDGLDDRTASKRVTPEDDTCAAFAALHARIAPRFRRREVRERAYRYLAGLIEPAGRRTGRQLAAAAGEGRPDGMRRLLRDANWDADTLRDDLRDYVVEHLGDPE